MQIYSTFNTEKAVQAQWLVGVDAARIVLNREQQQCSGRSKAVISKQTWQQSRASKSVFLAFLQSDKRCKMFTKNA